MRPVKNEGMNGLEPPIEFVTDGRTYEPPGPRSDEFTVLFGTLLTGPAAPPFGASLVVKFLAELTTPDGTRVLANAQLDYPVADESPGEGPFVLLRGVRASDLPAGTLIVTYGTVS